MADSSQSLTPSARDEQATKWSARVEYKKHFIPLESNPEVFTDLIRRLGVSAKLAFHDVLSLEEPDLLALIPRPALALVLVFPTSEAHEAYLTEREARHDTAPYAGKGDDETARWFKQTINNACGLYAILHAVSNGGAREFVLPDSHLAALIRTCTPLGIDDRARAVEEDAALEAEYGAVARRGDSAAPESAEDEVDFHYVCFVKSHRDGHMYEMDGDRISGPVDWGLLGPDEDLLSEPALRSVRGFVNLVARDVGFSLLALAPAQ